MDLSAWSNAWITGLFVLGLATLLAGGHALVVGSSRLAQRLGIHPIIIGLTVVALGTSMPEFIVSFFAAIKGKTDVALGNVVGSNVSNIGLILGISALCRPLVVNKRLLRFELPLVLLVSIYFWIICMNGVLGRLDGLSLFVGFILYLLVVIYYARKRSDRSVKAELSVGASMNLALILTFIIIGIVGLRYGADWVVESASEMSRRFGVSELILALTVVAIGTSLPELATSLVAAVKRESDLSIGNILGSNIFNMMAIAGPTAIANPLPVSTTVVHYHLPIMVGLTILLFPIVWSGKQVGRVEGGLLLIAYLVIFTWWAT